MENIPMNIGKIVQKTQFYHRVQNRYSILSERTY